MIMKTRKATKKDLEAILALSDLMVKFHTNFDPYYAIYTKYEDPKEFYKKQLAKKNTLYVVTENDKKEIVAFASAYIISIPKAKAPSIGVLVANFVKEKYRGMGIGTKQFTYRIDWLKRHHVKYVEMNVDARNKKALALWKKYGFKDYQVKLKIDL